VSAALDECAWPAVRLAELLATLGRGANLALREDDPAPVTRAVIDAGRPALARWLEATCDWMGFEAEPITVLYRDLERTLAAIAPAVIMLPGAEPRYFGIAGGRGDRVELLGLDHRRRTVSVARLREVLCEHVETEAAPALERFAVHIPAVRRRRALPTLRRELIGTTQVSGLFVLRMSPGAPAWRQLRNAGLTRRLGAILGGHLLQYVAWLASWWMLGRGALAGHLDTGWIAAWAVLLLTSQFIRVAMLRAEGRLAVLAGALLKQRLLLGTLRIPTDVVRGEGVGQLLGRVLESEAVESLALGGGLTTLEALMELLAAPFVLWLGAGGGVHVFLFALTIAGTVALGIGYYRRRLAWTKTRLAMTNDLVESMVGHRTRIAQQPPAEWNDDADHALETYLERGASMDRHAVRFRALVARGWLLFGLAGLAPAFIRGGVDSTAIALALGGVLLAKRALQRLATSFVQLSDAAIAFRQISRLYGAAARRDSIGVPSFAASPNVAASLVEAYDVTFRYNERSEPALRADNLAIAPGERFLLEGPSGGGKSTLAAVLTGMRTPQHGVLLAGGLDRATLGLDGWRRRVASAPQFHENHVLSETFAFNLLMGRMWPPDRAATEEAQAICRELGLDGLLARMPGGWMQMVGETGWQLSHGERSRLYIARALLQGPDLIVFDESFGALDPENAQRALDCVLARARSVLVIAHP
jgi:ATP-binding cassette subfamily B protein